MPKHYDCTKQGALTRLEFILIPLHVYQQLPNYEILKTGSLFMPPSGSKAIYKCERYLSIKDT